MILDAVGADQIRSGIATAADTATGHATDVAAFGGILAAAADRYEQLGMTASTLSHLRAAAASTTTAHAHLGTADEQLQAALSDFDARDGHVAAAVADAGNLMQAAGYAETFTLPHAAASAGRSGPDRPTQDRPAEDGSPELQQEPEAGPAEHLLALEDIRNGLAWLANNEGNPDWRPSAPSPQLAAQLAADNAADEQADAQGMPAPDRATCFTHQSWLADCVQDPSHSNPGLAGTPGSSYNWCAEHRLPVQVCACWPATVEGRPPSPQATGGDPAAAWAGGVVQAPPPYEAPRDEGSDEFYAFGGDLRDGKPPYWARREGRTVIAQSLGKEITRTEHPDLDTARAAFAEESCDPDGAGAPRCHDLIEVHWGDHEGRQLRVSAVTAGPGRGDYLVEAQPTGGGPRVRADLSFGQYRIVRRRPAPRTS